MSGFGEGSERSSSAGGVTAGDLREAHQRNQQHLQNDMSGDQFRFMPGVRFDTDPRGIGEVAPTFNPVEPEPRALTPDFLPQPGPSTDDRMAAMEQELTKFKKLYGDSENQKGELRRQAEEMQRQFGGMPQFGGSPMPGVPGYPGYPVYPPQGYPQAPPPPNGYPPQNYGGYYPPPQAPPQQQEPQRLFPDRDPNEYPTYAELEDILTNEVAPALRSIRQDTREEAVAEMQRRLPTWDVAPNEEAQSLWVLRQRFPNFDARFAPTERNSMIQDYTRFIRAAAGTPTQPISQVPTPQRVGHVTSMPGQGGNGYQVPQTIVVDPSSVVRRDMYIESATGVASPESSQPTDVRVQFQQEMANLDAAYKAKTGNPAPASAMKALLMKYGVQEAHDFGPDVAHRA